MPRLRGVRGVFALLLASLLVLNGTPFVSAATALSPGEAAVVANTGGDTILLRSDAGYQFAVLAHLEAGTPVTVLAGPITGDDGNLWYCIDADGTTGYLFAAYLAPAAEVSAATAATDNGGQSSEAKVVAGTGGEGLRLRDGADLSAAVLGVVPEGTTVTLTGAPRLNGGQAWYPASYDGLTGWLAADYLGAASNGVAPATDQQSLALTIGEHVAVGSTGGWDLRLRAAVGLDADTIAAAPEGTVLRILDGPLTDSAGNAWYAVDYDGIQGYSSAAYLAWTDAALTARTPVVAAASAASLGTGDHAAVSNTGGWPLRIRTAASLDGGVVAAAPEGAVLQVLDASTIDAAGNSWYPINYDGLQGFAGAGYLSATGAALSARQPLATASSATNAASATSDALGAGSRVAVSDTGGWNLRLRTAAGLDSAVIGAADEGTVLLVVNSPTTDAQGNTWYDVNYDGIDGFARASYLSPTEAALSTRPVAPAPAPAIVAAAAPAAAPAPAAPALAQAAAPAPDPAPAAQPTAAPRPSPTPTPPPVPKPSPTPAPAPAASATGNFIYPAQGTFTQGFGEDVATYGPGGHNGIDIANSVGTTVVASDAGTVVFAGWHGGLGNAVIIDHGNGFRTEYGHASALKVSVGQHVAQGQAIMAMGSTGFSTGSHVHFSVVKNGVYVNPLNYLSR